MVAFADDRILNAVRTLRRLMMTRSWIVCVAASVLSFSGSAFAGQVLITEEEAKLPPPKGAIAADRRGILRGPKVEFVSQGETRSPTKLQLKFESFGGTRIDPDSVKFTYLRTPNVDLTPRIKAFIQPTGISIQDAELPAGEHMVRVDVKDSDGRAGSTSFVLKVLP
jgi:hypothetical protein